jgi:hypothetical protein
MVRTLIDFAPTQLALAPRPLEGELTSSWLYRVAAANLVKMEELLSGLMDVYPDVGLYLNRRLWPFTVLNSWTGGLSTGLNSWKNCT